MVKARMAWRSLADSPRGEFAASSLTLTKYDTNMCIYIYIYICTLNVLL